MLRYEAEKRDFAPLITELSNKIDSKINPESFQDKLEWITFESNYLRRVRSYALLPTAYRDRLHHTEFRKVRASKRAQDNGHNRTFSCSDCDNCIPLSYGKVCLALSIGNRLH